MAEIFIKAPGEKEVAKPATRHQLDFLKLHRDEIEWNLPAFNVLKNAGIATMAHMVSLNEDQLRRLPRATVRIVNEFKGKAAMHHIGLGSVFSDRAGNSLNVSDVLAGSVPAVEASAVRKPLTAGQLEMLQRDIEQLDLLVKATNILQDAGINTVAEAVARGERKILNLPGSDMKVLGDLKDTLAGCGLVLGSVFYDRATGFELTVGEILTARSHRGIDVDTSGRRTPEPLSPVLRAALLPVYREAGVEVGEWPLPSRAQEVLAQVLAPVAAKT